MANATFSDGLPPLPTYETRPMPDLLPFISDFWLSLIAPHVAYWVMSMFFHVIDVYDLFPHYRLHTPEEITQRNLATRFQVARDVVLEQILQVFTATVLSLTEPQQQTGMEDYEVAVWATRIRLAQRSLPSLLSVLGLNATAISKNMASSHPLIAGALAGGHYPFLTTQLDGVSGVQVPAFAIWEMMVAKAVYWFIIPLIQVLFAIFFLDTWQYFWHRAMHVNKWMYTHWHARHHRLYVPYAYGALYNHPIEGFLLDTLGASLAYKASFMTPRYGMFFFVGSTMKTVDDHCGYSLPWDPLQRISSNNAAYHDIHHQSWGIKANFSQPFLTFWDRLLGTMWKGDANSKYERTRISAAKKSKAPAPTPNGKAAPSPVANGKATAPSPLANGKARARLQQNGKAVAQR
ncbi:fatty acid hydroxylase superfamily-domain-containing protein [Schizothecium vesticola]|uniref:Fatty acid hydroxylase superfamily-domain-containing protein n=1 Tax=Schizothecium vesticola TaxID=314040 RepID=A0AA40KBS6_9PEZI|nr:fatty acid hydroxylase superfamily-domain-containing protein [Schizothecium vesticola]